MCIYVKIQNKQIKGGNNFEDTANYSAVPSISTENSCGNCFLCFFICYYRCHTDYQQSDDRSGAYPTGSAESYCFCSCFNLTADSG